ncbi:MAG TPA: flagellar biosynthetic protein FliR [Tichowtungia sp.]|nr:flagellar biosynthetic protein FliR [Tichowtungia sp.]
MSITVLFGDYPVVFLLVLFRVLALVFSLPFFGVMNSGRRLAIGAAVPVTLLFCMSLPPEFSEAAAEIRTTGDVLFALLGESLLGVAIGAVCGVFIAIFNAAGLLAARGASLSMAQGIDPTTGVSSGVLSTLLTMFFTLFFVTLNAHLVLIRLVSESFGSIGVPWMGWMDCGLDLVRLGSHIFRAGLLMALPVMVVSLLVSIAMGLMARLAQEFNVLFLSLPFRLASGIFILGMSILLGETFFRGVASDLLSTVETFLNLS